MESVGIVKGRTIKLDGVLHGYEGKRVRVRVEPIEPETVLAAEQQALWNQWVAQGPQGPIGEDDGEDEVWP